MSERLTEIFVGSSSDFDEKTRVLVTVDGRDVGVFAHEGELFAYENRCLHQGGPVCEGRIMGKVEPLMRPDGAIAGERFSTDQHHLICPWHGWEYEVRTGRCVTDRRRGLRPYRVVERDGDVYLLVPDG